jgi:hypothetical protein
MSTAIVINIALATIVLTAIVGLIAVSIVTASADRGFTLVRRARRPRFELATTRPTARWIPEA